MESDTDKIRTSAIPKHIQESVSLTRLHIVSLAGFLISDKILRDPSSIGVVPSDHCVTVTVSQEYRIDDLDIICSSECRNHIDGADNCFIERSASKGEALRTGMSRVMGSSASEQPEVVQCFDIIPLVHSTTEEVVEGEFMRRAIGVSIRIPLLNFAALFPPGLCFITIEIIDCDWAIFV